MFLLTYDFTLGSICFMKLGLPQLTLIDLKPILSEIRIEHLLVFWFHVIEMPFSILSLSGILN